MYMYWRQGELSTWTFVSRDEIKRTNSSMAFWAIQLAFVPTSLQENNNEKHFFKRKFDQKEEDKMHVKNVLATFQSSSNMLMY